MLIAALLWTVFSAIVFFGPTLLGLARYSGAAPPPAAPEAAAPS